MKGEVQRCDILVPPGKSGRHFFNSSPYRSCRFEGLGRMAKNVAVVGVDLSNLVC